MEHIQAILDSLGHLFDDDPRTKGGILLSALAVTSAAFVTKLFRRKPDGHSHIRVDVPPGQQVTVIVGKDETGGL